MHRTVQNRSKLSLKRKKIKKDLPPTSSHRTPSSPENTNAPTSTESQSTSSDFSKIASSKSRSRFSLILEKVNVSVSDKGRSTSQSPLSASEEDERSVSQNASENILETKEAVLEERSSEPQGNYCRAVERDSRANSTKTEKVSISKNPSSTSEMEDGSDFKDPILPLVRRKRDIQNNYMKTIEEEQLQLALALSVSVGNNCPEADRELEQLLIDTGGKRRKKRAKLAKTEQTVPPLLAITSEQTRELLAQRAQELLKSSTLDDDNEIQCTPAFRSSELTSNAEPSLSPIKDQDLFVTGDALRTCGKESSDYLALSPELECAQVEGDELEMQMDLNIVATEQESDARNKSFAAEFQHFDYPTMWELTTFKKSDNKDFYVPALDSIISPVAEKQELSAVQLTPLPSIPTVGETSDSTCPKLPLTGNREGVSRLCSDFRALLGSSLFSDVEIATSGGTVISSHAVILASRCPSLKEVLVEATSRPIRLDFTDYVDRVVLSFLEFLYTGALPSLREQDRIALGTLAKEWLLGELELACAESLEAAPDGNTLGDGTTDSLSATVTRDSLEGNNSNKTAVNEPLLHFDPEIVNSDSVPVAPITDDGNNISVDISESPELIDLSQSSGSNSPGLEYLSACRHSPQELSHDPVPISASPVIKVDESVTPTDLSLSQGRVTETSSPSSTVNGPSPVAGVRITGDIQREASEPHSHISISSVESHEIPKEKREVASTPSPVHIVPLPPCDSDELFSPSPKSDNETTSCDRQLPRLPPTTDETAKCREQEEMTSQSISGEQSQRKSDTELEVFMDGVFAGGTGVSQIFTDSFTALQTVVPLGGMESIEMPQSSAVTTPGAHLSTGDQLRSQARVSEHGIRMEMFTTPLGVGQFHLETDEDITPLPDYRTMVTPALKKRCAQFGVKPLAKRKMIAKLEEIYEYTHPLVDEDGAILEQPQEPLTKGSTRDSKSKRAKKSITENTQKEESFEDLKLKVRASICSNKQLYEDILLYKPLELSSIQSKLKESGIAVAKEKLRDILDQWCVTFTIPRHTETQRTEASQAPN